MPFLAYIIHFLAAAILTNGIPHFVNGVSGRRFRTPFVRFGGGDLSSPIVNVAWGWLNFLVAFALFAGVGPLFIGTLGDTIFVAAGMLLAGLALARIFARDQACATGAFRFRQER
ncbi:hypothetical protein [Rhizobium halophytocola]|uniref:Uncharacterized protein n=1 Tax=Rhizobium halophytocola TaxID=735519 RepID=A0ABS4E618_9HYPH|nr:hypothetical protein [Rhizobium halophytocola]MBP1853363.1 hypothetical protein [Rhizobium halophytocola]